MAKILHPLAEVFGFAATDMSAPANRHRTKRLCPFNNKVPNCTKDKAQDPLGVCSVFHENEAVITCPIRFRQQWLIADDAAEFFFGADAKWTTLTEVRLKDADGGSAGNIDVVLSMLSSPIGDTPRSSVPINMSRMYLFTDRSKL